MSWFRSLTSEFRPCSPSANGLHWRPDTEYLSGLTDMFIKWSLAPLWDGLNINKSASKVTKKPPHQYLKMEISKYMEWSSQPKQWTIHYSRWFQDTINPVDLLEFLHLIIFLYTSTFNVWEYLAAAWDKSSYHKSQHICLKESHQHEHAQPQQKCLLSETPDQHSNVPLKILSVNSWAAPFYCFSLFIHVNIGRKSTLKNNFQQLIFFFKYFQRE